MDVEDYHNDIKVLQPLESVNIFQKISGIYKVDPKIFKPKTKCHTTKFVRSKQFL